MRRIVAIGGGGFMMEDRPSLLDDYVVSLAAARRPRICFIPTASGDGEDALEKFYRAFARYPAQLSHLAFFSKPRPGAIALGAFEHALAEQDVIYVGGGNTRSMLAVWREWGVPQALRNAAAHGALLAGVSAGAICWFAHGLTNSLGPGFEPVRGLGLLPGGFCPHADGDPERIPALIDLIDRGVLPATIAVDDGAAVHLTDEAGPRVVSGAPGRGARRVSAGGVIAPLEALPAY
jgi:dipeptidase E